MRSPLRGLHFPYVFCVLGLFEPVCVSNHVSKVAFCPSPLPTSPSRSQLCSLSSGPRGGERQQMGSGQRPGAPDSKRPGCGVEAASIRKLLFPWEPTNHWRKLKMSPLRTAIKSSKKIAIVQMICCCVLIRMLMTLTLGNSEGLQLLPYAIPFFIGNLWENKWKTYC